MSSLARDPGVLPLLSGPRARPPPENSSARGRLAAGRGPAAAGLRGHGAVAERGGGPGAGGAQRPRPGDAATRRGWERGAGWEGGGGGGNGRGGWQWRGGRGRGGRGGGSRNKDMRHILALLVLRECGNDRL